MMLYIILPGFQYDNNSSPATADFRTQWLTSSTAEDVLLAERVS